MPHPDLPTTAVNHGTQQGVGEGTTGRRRRNPRTKVDDVEIAEATGLSLGEDGFFHPIETDPEGNLKVRIKGIIELLEEVVSTNRAIVRAMAEAHDLNFEDLFDC